MPSGSSSGSVGSSGPIAPQGGTMGGNSEWRGASLCAIAFALQAQAPPAPQQPGAEPAAQADRAIIITGSRIPRRNLTAVSPVTVVQQEEAKLEGVTLTEELLNQLPMVSPSQGAFT